MNSQRRHAAVGFHSGELAVQRHAGMQAQAARLAPMVGPAELRAGIAAFLADATFAALTARDRAGRLWISPLLAPPGFLHASGPSTLRIGTPLPSADPLHSLPAGQPAGLIVIDFTTRRRVRINGILTQSDTAGSTLDVDQAYGNCPQYIQQRHITIDEKPRHPALSSEYNGELLRETDIRLIESADTFFSEPPTSTRATMRHTAADPPASSASPPKGCGGPTIRATTCSTASATSPSTPPPHCCSSTSPPATRCSCPAQPPWSGTPRPRATTAKPDVASNSHPDRSSPPSSEG